MNHNYKLTDFKNPEYETDTDLMDINVTIFLRNSLELPSVLEQRLEGIINNLISEYEHENNTVIPLDDMDLENCIEVNTREDSLSLLVYIGFEGSELLHRKEIISTNDEHYDVIKRFFFVKLDEYVSEQIKRIEKSV